jgi:hypothetical protein
MSSGKCVRTVVSERIFADLRSHQIFSKSSYRCRAFPHAYLRCGIDGSRWRRDGSASGAQFSRWLVPARLPRRHISFRHPSEKTPSDDLSSFITDNKQHLAESNTVSSPPCRLLAHLDTSIMARIDGTTLLVGVRPAHSLVRDKLVTTSWTPL